VARFLEFVNLADVFNFDIRGTILAPFQFVLDLAKFAVVKLFSAVCLYGAEGYYALRCQPIVQEKPSG
jgi:hypothetical protein